ncbi:ACP S-malonyltransferase [Amycolatopsis sp. lyj-346]|uniref:ACP S-malonyltransferase n=1 Tax=Amycolatopsis sp. lyj-346 TaxID=2789289 RepID=UPI00397DC9B1
MPGDVLMFPGQGAQYPGMGDELFGRYPDLCAQADAAIGYPLTELCRSDPGGRLQQTAHTQPAIYLVSCLAYLAHAEQAGGEVTGPLVGHSVGLYAALFAAEVVDLLGGLEIVARRGELMQAVEGGGMLAVLGTGAPHVDRDLARWEFFDVEVANYNSPEQVVLSGPADRLTELTPLLEEAGHRCVPLAVSGAFHSRHMEPCRREFARFLLDREFGPPVRPVVSSTTGQVVTVARLLEEMVFQLVKPVRWWQTVEYLARAGATAFHEVGPGTVLTDLTPKILGGAPPRAERRV